MVRYAKEKNFGGGPKPPENPEALEVLRAIFGIFDRARILRLSKIEDHHSLQKYQNGE
jgi:hypothetical protein